MSTLRILSPLLAWGTSHNLEPNLQRLAASPPPTKSARGDQLAGGIWLLRDDEGLQSTACAGLWPSPCPCPPRITGLASVPSVRGDPRSLLIRSSPSIKRDIQTDVQPRDGHRDYPSAVAILRCPIIADRVKNPRPNSLATCRFPRCRVLPFVGSILWFSTMPRALAASPEPHLGFDLATSPTSHGSLSVDRLHGS